MKRKRHSAREIVAKLRQADEMAAKGMLQSDIARSLGVSVMTYHRWRSSRLAHEGAAAERGEQKPTDRLADSDQNARLGELQLENARLRRLLTDTLLEKAKLEEMR
jgi:transposase